MSATAPLPQLTLKTIVLGLVLSMVLAGANGNLDVLAVAAELPAIVGFLAIAGLVAYLYRVTTRD